MARCRGERRVALPKQVLFENHFMKGGNKQGGAPAIRLAAGRSTMKVGLFIPCFMDQFYPDSCWSVHDVLAELGVDVHFPSRQSCCGQPWFNNGLCSEAQSMACQLESCFRDFDAVVCPSASCTAMIREHYSTLEHAEQLRGFQDKVFEFCEFLVDVLKVQHIPACFPHKVGLHQSCHGLREIRLASASERHVPFFSKPRQVLQMVEGLELVTLKREDECCGFGGTFAIAEEAVSCSMGRDRIEDHLQAGAQVIVSTDMSCLMHMGGLLRRQQNAIPTVHIADILAGKVKV